MAIELGKRYTFKFNNATWKVTDVYNINWNDGTKSVEYKVKSHIGLTRYFEIALNQNKKVNNYSFWQKIIDKNHFLSEIDYNLKDKVLIGKAEFPKEITYKNITYYFDERNDGICKYTYDEDEVVNSLDYTNEDDSQFLSIELWDDEVEISTGIPIKENQISNIVKSEPNFMDSVLLKLIGKNITTILGILFFLIFLSLDRCSSASWNGESNNNDSTKVHRSNNYYRGRSSGGFGK